MSAARDDFVVRHLASGVIAELTRPATAAVVAELPGRPGQSIDAGTVRQRTGLGPREFWTTVARLVDIRVVHHDSGADDHDGGRLSLARGAVHALVDQLVADSPLVPILAERPELRAFVERGRVVRMPSEPRLLEQLYRALAEIVEAGTELTEDEVNRAIVVVHDDPAQIRRGLVDRQLLDRSPGTLSYRRSTA